ncbi:MAG: hypothetical protein CMM50_17650 [Rhodospirillaceae bacterium]|nr:hypothetical protein [Rhodospirillaceae bacterium]
MNFRDDKRAASSPVEASESNWERLRELESSREELQSRNEELTTVNAQLEHKVTELDGARHDLNNLLNSIEIPTLVLDANLDIKWFTPTIEMLIELVPDDIGRPIGHFVRKFEDDRFLDDAYAVLLNSRIMEEEVHAANGRWYVRRIMPFRTDDGAVAGVVATFIDSTRPREALDELRSLLEAAPDPTAVVDVDGRINRANSELLRLFGYQSDEVLGRPVEILMPERFREKHKDNVKRFFATPKTRSMGEGLALFGRAKDGREFPIDVKLSPAYFDHEFVTIAAIRDISKQKALEQSLIDSRRNLERRVSERTAELQRSQTELHRAIRLAELGELTTGIAHELTQPLTAIGSYMEVCGTVLEADDLTMAKDLGRKALEQARHAIDIIERIRSLATATDTIRAPQDINALVRDAATLMFAGASDRGIETDLSLTPDLPPVDADRVQIQQVLLNVIRNAFDAVSGMANGRVLVETRRGADHMVEIAVADTGPGIPKDIAKKLFQPFVTTKSGGMGIGLSLSRSIVEAHGGRLTFATRPGDGTEFVVSLPVNNEEA